MYPASRCLSKLPEAFKLAVKSLQSWYFQHSSKNSLLQLGPKYQEISLWVAFQNLCPIFFLPGAEVCCGQMNKIRLTPEHAQVSHMFLDKESTLTLSLTRNSINFGSKIEH